MTKNYIFLIGSILATFIVVGFLQFSRQTAPTSNESEQSSQYKEEVTPTPTETTQFDKNSVDSSSPDPNATDQNSPTLELVATESGQLAIDLLASNAQIETIDYGDAGEFVTNINGLAADSEHYWAFYVNNQYAEQGVSQTKLVEGDIIKFVYETIWKSE